MTPAPRAVLNTKKRAKVRKMLRSKCWQESSDRALAQAAEVSKNFVAQVRRELIGLGMHPPRDEEGDARYKYKPGAAARGGYVYGEDGRVIRETEWLRQQAAKKKAKRAKGG